MANKITTLVDVNDNTTQLYPRTKASAVSDTAGNSVESLLIYQGNDASAGSVGVNADQLQGYSVNQLLKLFYPVGSIYQNTSNTNPATFITGTTWVLRSSVALASEHVFGNGYNLGITEGNNLYGAAIGSSNMFAYSNAYGKNVGLTSLSGGIGTSRSVGVPTKAQTGNNPEYSGLIADTITVYTWERTA